MEAALILPDRFWSKVEKGNRCWEWKAYKSESRHGRFKLNGKVRYAHVLSWSHSYGTPKGLVLHKCGNASCVNPDHLYIGNNKQNTEDSVRDGTHFCSSKQKCKRGHALSGNNVFRVGNGQRRCRVCNRASALKSYHRRKKAVVWEQQ